MLTLLISIELFKLMSKLMSLAQIFCDTRDHFRDRLTQEKTAWIQALSQGESPQLSAEVSAYLNKIENSWEKRLAVSFNLDL